MTYSELKQKVLSYLDYYDDEVEAQIDYFIDVSEKEVARILRVPYNEKLVELEFCEDTVTPNGTVTVCKNEVYIPQDFIEVKEMFVQETSEPIKMTEFSALMRKKAGIDTSTEGSGRYFAMMGNRFFIYPELCEEQTVLLNYYSDPVNMHDGLEDTSYILTIAPELLMYLALKHAMVFLRNDEDAGKYNALAQNSLEQIRVQVSRMENKPSMKVVPRRF